MNIEFSKNHIWENSGYKDSLQEIDSKFDQGWNQWQPSFVKDHLKETELKRIEDWVRDLKDKGIEYLIVIGMGGSALGAKAIQKYGFQNADKILFWEGPHPSLLRKYSSILENQKSALLWVSKSGTTLESRVNLALIREFFSGIPEYFVTSNPHKINDICADEKKIFQIPENLGGRFSVVSHVGIMPPVFMGANMKDFLKGFHYANDEYHISIPMEDNQAKKNAYELFSLLKQGYYGVVFWLYAKELLGWGDWIVQLWGESIGKKADIQALPYLARGPEDQHSLLQFFQEGPNKLMHIFCHTKSYAPFNARLSNEHFGVFAGHTLWEVLQAQMSGIELALSEAERPVSEYLFPQIYKDQIDQIEPDLELMGKWMGYWMYVVTYLCYLYEVNPFDQPGVEKGKKYCTEILENKKSKNSLQSSVEI